MERTRKRPQCVALEGALRKRARLPCRSLAVLWLCASALACGQTQHQAASVVDYLYSGDVGRLEQEAIPVLRLPLRVGVAFVPSASFAEEPISEKQKIELLKQISAEFEELEFVQSIEEIPSAYLRPRGGFTNVDQLRTMFGIDVIVLLSYDQTQFTAEGWTTLSYWTLIGAYVVQGEKNDTHTMVDAAVYDIESRKLLFRAPGVSQVKGRATPINLEEELRLDSDQGFQVAAADLVTNLQTSLGEFREDVRNQRTQVQVSEKPGYTGAGRVDLLLIVAALLLAAAAPWMPRKPR